MSDRPPETPASDELPTGEEMARIQGSRPCLACGQDLLGQPIRKATPYSFLIARCSECGTVTPLQEYPVLGPWGRRLGGVLIALYIFISLLFLILHGCLTWLFTYMNTYEGLRPTGRGLEALISENRPDYDDSGWRNINPEWLDQIEPALIADTFSYRYFLSPDMLPGVIGGLVLAFIFGCLWSVYLLGVRRAWLWVTSFVAIMFGWFMTLVGVWTIGSTSGKVTSVELAIQEFGIGTSMFFSMLWMAAALLGTFIGRPGCRLVSAFVLPPRQRVALAPLWTCDGLKPPFRKWWDRT